MVQRLIDDMNEGYWREKYQKEMQSRYGHLIEGAPKAKLLFMEED